MERQNLISFLQIMKIKQIFRKAGIILLACLSAAVGVAQAVDFKDVPPSHPNYTAIMDLKERGTISGYPDGTYKPDQVVNRVEALKIILLGAAVVVPDNTGTAGFSDTLANEWYSKYLLKAKDLGVVSGYPDGTFRPTQTVNLVENLKMLIETRNINLSAVFVGENPFADAFKDQWYAKYVQYAKDHLWITGDADNKIYPSQGMTRGKLAQLLYNSIHETPMDQPPQEEGGGQTTYDALMVNIVGSKFMKEEMTIPQGATVRWTNNDFVQHTVTSDDGIFASPTLDNGDTFEYTFDTIGTFKYHCTIHPGMNGTIIVKPANQVPTV